ncbi:MAG TPA: 50S ribosomal protein L5 [Thermoplasmata archaeon]|nr:50S ribosomal protein L5 [Thermoplasmata archaeon]
MTEEKDRAQEQEKTTKENPMREIIVGKVVVNIGAGQGGEHLQKAEKVIQLLTNKKPVRTYAKATNKDLGVRKGMPIGCKTTLRGDVCYEFIKKALWIRNNKLPNYCFDSSGNLSFGISDYTDFEGMKYDPDIGIFGLDINIVLERRGFRVARRRRKRAKIGHNHRVAREEAIKFMMDKFHIEVI